MRGTGQPLTDGGIRLTRPISSGLAHCLMLYQRLMNGAVNNATCVSDCVFTSVFGCFAGDRGGDVTSKAAFYLPVIIVVGNLFTRRLGGVSQELFPPPLFLQLTRRHHTAAFEACCLI